MIYGELGRAPIQAVIDQNMLNLWARIMNAKNKQICKTLYQVTCKLHRIGAVKPDWILLCTDLSE